MPTSPDDNYYIDKADDPLARAGANSLVGLGMGLTSKLYNYFQDKQQAAKAAEAYAKKYCDRYGKIRLLGMQQDIDLEDVYTAVKFLDSLSISNRFGSLNALEDDYRNAGNRRFQRGKCKSEKGSKVVNEHQYLYVLGNPGAGKSTFLRRVGLEALKGHSGNYQHDLIPVVIELKQFNQGNVDLINAIANEMAYFNFPDQRKATEYYLKEGKLLLLFDGLDEVPNAYSDEVQNKIDDLKTKYSHRDKYKRDNRFIISCRIAAYRSSLTGFTTVELADFDEEQIEKFIHNWFSSELDKENNVAEECWGKLSQPEYKASLELAQTPLLLTFLCITYDTYQDFPAQRSQLYSEALDILLRKWDAQKRIKRDKIYANWSINLELALLSELAHDFFSRDELFFTKESILEYIEVFLSDTEGDVRFIDSEAVLDAIAIQQGILVERAAGIYSFSHLTLQEYLTAKYISQDNKRIERLVAEHLTDERWKEVFLLVAGIKNNADNLLLLMEKETHKLIINNNKLVNLLVWSKQLSGKSDTDLKALSKQFVLTSHIIIIASTDFIYQDLLGNIINAAFDIISIIDDVDNELYNQAKEYPYNIYMIVFFAIAQCYVRSTIKLIDEFTAYIKWLKEHNICSGIKFNSVMSQLESLKISIPDDSKPRQIKIAFIRTIVDFWLEAIGYKSKQILFNRQEIGEIYNYFYAVRLICICQKSSNRIKHKTWSEIKCRMLIPV